VTSPELADGNYEGECVRVGNIIKFGVEGQKLVDSLCRKGEIRIKDTPKTVT
jgi:hypothetical protein